MRNPAAYNNSDVQHGFRQVFLDADKNHNGSIERPEFPSLIDGYFNSKHIKPTMHDFDDYFKKIDLNQDGKISFEDYDFFIKIVYDTEYLPALEQEIERRKGKRAKGDQ